MTAKMIWLYQCSDCSADMATESAFTRDEGPPARAIECVGCETGTMVPVRQMTSAELDRWAEGVEGWSVVGPHKDFAEGDHD